MDLARRHAGARAGAGGTGAVRRPRTTRPTPTRGSAKLNADPAAQRRLLDLQDLDSASDRLDHRRAGLPAHAELARLTDERARVDDEHGARQTEIEDLDRALRKADADVEQVRTRLDRDVQRLDRGEVASAKELEGLQHEVESLRRRQGDLEEIELDVMERRDAAVAARAALAGRLGELGAAIERVRGERDAATAELDVEQADVRSRRAAVATELPADLLALYDRLRAQLGGVAAAALRGGRCEGCRMELNTAEVARLGRLPADAVTRCEECGRILVRTGGAGR